MKYNNENNITLKINDNSNNLEKYSQIEVYDLSGRKLDLSVCRNDIKLLKYIGNDENININSAKNYADMGIDIFNTSSDFFNDICFKCDNDDGKDIILNDRRTDIYKNISFCQNGCKYEGMNYDLMVANCIWDSSSLQGGASQSEYKYNITETIQFDALIKSFLSDSLLVFNLDILKCYNLVFNAKLLKTNIGFYFMLTMKASQISFLVIFLIKRLKPIKNYLISFTTLAHPIKRKININTNKNTNQILLKKDSELNRKNNINVIVNNSSKKLLMNQNKDIICSNNELLFKNEIIAQNKLKLKEKNKNDIIINNLRNKKEKKFALASPVLNDESKCSNDKFEKNIINIENIEHKETVVSEEEKIQIQSEDNCINEIKITQNDEELQDLEFNEAINQDKRSLFRMYWSYLVDSQIILGTFFTENYLDLFIIKLSFLMFTFQISSFFKCFILYRWIYF